jgi:hypothetical protein
LTRTEWKRASGFGLRKFVIKTGENTVYLYNQEGKLLSAAPFLCNINNINMKKFTLQAISALTKKKIESFKEVYEKLYKVKTVLWELYRIPISNKEFFDEYAKHFIVRRKTRFKMSVRPNSLGLFFAEIQVPTGKTQMRFMNDNPLELLFHLFFTLECFIGKEELPYTLSQSWYRDYQIYADRSVLDATARHNVEQAYSNYIYEQILKTFRTTEKVTYLPMMEFLRKISDENKYYVMQTILEDPHFRIDENEFLIYTPVLDIPITIR